MANKLVTEADERMKKILEATRRELAGIRTGDVILEVNRQKVTSVKEAQAEAQKDPSAKSLLVLLRRGEATLFAALELK